MLRIEPFTESQLHRLCDVLAHPATGLTGSEIGTFLLRLEVPDLGAGVTKRSRLYDGLMSRQVRDQSGGVVAEFIRTSMDPMRYTGMLLMFENRRAAINDVLGELGLELKEDGSVRYRANARAPLEAEAKAHELKEEVKKRKYHPLLLESVHGACLERGNFHTAHEIVRVLADRIRQMTGLSSDGVELIDRAFGGWNLGRVPLAGFNELRTPTDKSEHAAVALFMRGLFGHFHVSPGQSPRVEWSLSDEDLMDLMGTASFCHRKLDKAKRLRAAPSYQGH